MMSGIGSYLAGGNAVLRAISRRRVRRYLRSSSLVERGFAYAAVNSIQSGVAAFARV